MLYYIFINPQCWSAFKGRLPEIRSVSIRIPGKVKQSKCGGLQKAEEVLVFGTQRRWEEISWKIKKLKWVRAQPFSVSQTQQEQGEEWRRHLEMFAEALAEPGHEGSGTCRCTGALPHSQPLYFLICPHSLQARGLSGESQAGDEGAWS